MELGAVANPAFRSLAVLGVGLALLAGCVSRPAAPAEGGPPQRVEVHYAGGTVQEGVRRVPVGLGRPVDLVVTSDVADDVHLHGYDRKVAVPAGGSATLEFVADRPGVFEAELESRGEQLVQFEVR